MKKLHTLHIHNRKIALRSMRRRSYRVRFQRFQALHLLMQDEQ